MKQQWTTWSKLVMAVAIVMFASACAGTDNTMSGEAGLAVGSASELQDSQILHTFLVMNEGEIVTSRPVAEAGNAVGDQTAVEATMTLTGDPSVDVRNFASMMVAHHSTVIEKIQNAAGNTDLGLQPNQVSMTLNNTAQGVANRLETLDGMQEEMEYIQSQIVLHQNALNMLDHTLIPQADDAQLRQLLQEGRQDVANHLALAQQIHASMQTQMGQQPNQPVNQQPGQQSDPMNR